MDPKADLLADPLRRQKVSDLLRSELFEKIAQEAILAFTLTESTGTMDANTAIRAHFRLQGAIAFATYLLTFADPHTTPNRPTLQSLKPT